MRLTPTIIPFQIKSASTHSLLLIRAGSLARGSGPQTQRHQDGEHLASKHHRKAGRDTLNMSRVRIANPRPGSAKYTSESQARRYVRRGEAVRIGPDLHFLSDAEQRHMRNVEAHISVSERRASDVYVGSRKIWWNGVDIDGMHRPGEVIS
jgi:hypothetical protein